MLYCLLMIFTMMSYRLISVSAIKAAGSGSATLYCTFKASLSVKIPSSESTAPLETLLESLKLATLSSSRGTMMDLLVSLMLSPAAFAALVAALYWVYPAAILQGYKRYCLVNWKKQKQC